MRVDYLHSGGPGGEAIEARRRRRRRGVARQPHQLIDTTDLGKYIFEVIDRRRTASSTRAGLRRSTASGKRRRSFERRTGRSTSRFGFHGRTRRFASSSRKRDRAECVPAALGRPTSIRAPAVAASARRTRSAERLTLFESGPPSRKVDLLLISDGYSSRRRRNFAPTPRGSSTRCSRSSRSSRAARISTSGRCTCPRRALSVEFNIFGLERYALTYDNRALRKSPRPRRTTSSKSW